MFISVKSEFSLYPKCHAGEVIIISEGDITPGSFFPADDFFRWSFRVTSSRNLVVGRKGKRLLCAVFEGKNVDVLLSSQRGGFCCLLLRFQLFVAPFYQLPPKSGNIWEECYQCDFTFTPDYPTRHYAGHNYPLEVIGCVTPHPGSITQILHLLLSRKIPRLVGCCMRDELHSL